MMPPAACRKRAKGIMNLIPNGNEIRSNLSAAYEISDTKKDPIATDILRVSSSFLA
jgi:hypothetical protein